MSFTLIQQATPRLHRSELAVPGSNPSLFEKAAKGAADIIFLDLEDAVAPDDKEQARKNIVQGLNDLDWGTKTMMIRINVSTRITPIAMWSTSWRIARASI